MAAMIRAQQEKAKPQAQPPSLVERASGKPAGRVIILLLRVRGARVPCLAEQSMLRMARLLPDSRAAEKQHMLQPVTLIVVMVWFRPSVKGRDTRLEC